MVIKVDMEHARDRIKRNILKTALQYFGFHWAFINWIIMHVFCDSSYSSLVNGASLAWLSSSIGLRQGCPLSAFLFVLCTNMLSQMLHGVVEQGKLKVLEPVREGWRI